MAGERDDSVEPDRLEGTPHPRTRDILIGHPDAEQAFLDGVAEGRLHHAWLIGGPAGIGKATLAYRVARYLLAYGTGSGPLDRAGLSVGPDHPAARQIMAQAHPNLVVLRRTPASEKKAASTTIPVDAVRRAIGLFGSTAADGGYRVCIVDSAEDLTASSANALLKLVEEPPPRSVFLIVSHAPQRLLPTIRSRCRRLLLRPLSPVDLERAIRSLGHPWDTVDPALVHRAIGLAEGSVRRAVEMLDEDKIAVIGEVTRLLDGLPAADPKAVLRLAERLAARDAREDFDLALDTLSRWISTRLRAEAAQGAARLAPMVEVCENVARSAREIDVFNLDRRPLILSMFDDLARVVRMTS